MKVYMLLDRSGSMENLWNEALGSINSYVENLDKETEVMLAAFDSNGTSGLMIDNLNYSVLRDMKAGLWRKVTKDDATPRGGTPLVDAAAKMIFRIEEDNKEKAIFVVMTDGEENSSKTFTLSQVKNAISKMQTRGYEVIFMGANFDKIGNVASSFGLKESKWLNISAQNLEPFMKNFAHLTSTYAVSGANINYSQEDKLRAVAE